MRRAAAIALAVLAAAPASADVLSPAPAAEKTPAPVDPAEWLSDVRPGGAPRVQKRLFPKAHRLHLDLGLDDLSRGDFYVSFGVSAAASWWFGESLAADVVVGHYFPFLRGVADELRAQTGLVPDARPPGTLIRAGIRGSLGYGKLLVGERVLHLEPVWFCRAALLFADGTLAPGLDGGVGLLVHWSELFHTRLEFAVMPQLEHRSQWTPVLAVVPFVTIGARLPP